MKYGVKRICHNCLDEIGAGAEAMEHLSELAGYPPKKIVWVIRVTDGPQKGRLLMPKSGKTTTHIRLAHRFNEKDAHDYVAYIREQFGSTDLEAVTMPSPF